MDRHLTLEHNFGRTSGRVWAAGVVGRPDRAIAVAIRTRVLISLAEIGGPKRENLNEQAIRDLLRGIRDDAPIPPVVRVSRNPAPPTATLLDGLHRWRLSAGAGEVYRDFPRRNQVARMRKCAIAARAAKAIRVPVNSEGKKLNLEGKKSCPIMAIIRLLVKHYRLYCLSTALRG